MAHLVGLDLKLRLLTKIDAANFKASLVVTWSERQK